MGESMMWRKRLLSRLATQGMVGAALATGATFTAPASAQAPTRLVSACSGVSLPRSVVTGIVAPVVTGIAGPVETSVNGILDAPLLGVVQPDLSLNATGLLADAAAGDPITLQAVATDGTVVGPADQCRVTADSITLDTPAGIAIGGNQITGLGADGAPSFAAELDAVALGNNARAEAGAVGSLALGANSAVTAANSVALGAGSVAARGALAGYVAPGLAGTQGSAGEVSVGAPGALRQITNVAAGSVPTDAATVGQVSGVSDQVAALGAVAVQYDGVARDRVTLVGAGGTVVANVAPGTVAAGSAEAVNGGQLFATNAQVAANTAALAGLGTGAGAPVRYADAASPTTPNGGTVTDDATLTGASGGAVRLHNVADGVVAAGSADAVTGGQLFATNQGLGALDGRVGAMETQVGANTAAITDLQAGLGGSVAGITNLTTRVDANTAAITDLGARVDGNTTVLAALGTQVANQPLRYADAATPTVANGGTITDDATLAGATGGPVGLHNVRAGVLAAGSTDAVTGDQLFQTNTQVAANAGAIADLNTRLAGSTVGAVQYANAATPTTPNGGTPTNDVTLVGANPAAPVGLHNVAAGTVAATSTDAVNGGQLFAVQARADNSLQYDQDAAGARTNRATLLGGTADAAVTLANVADGAVSATSTEAVNGRQLNAVSSQTANSIQYDRDATGARSNQVTLAGANGAPVALGNVANGAVTATSTQAVTGQQLFATNQSVAQVAAVGANSVQYDAGRSSVTLGGGSGGSAVTVRNVAAGTSATDAVNVGQLQSGLQGAVAEALSYTDARLTAFSFDLRDVRRDLGAGTSAAMAAAALPQPTEPGRSMVAIGGGTYRGQTAVAFGASTFLNDGRSVLKLGATYDSRGRGGANAGFGFQF